ncbi:MAG TPA: M23 family metallopeptidase [Verrucomicrobiae bacterium]|nr:M23 family metallopeptidase [Verrucomicrobiae bacterium]
MPVRFFVLLFCWILPGEIMAQSQPQPIVLDPNGVSLIYPPFDTKDWILTRGTGSVTHLGDDYFAQDWALNCFSEGKKLFAGIAGSVLLNPVGDGSQDYYGNTVVIIDYQKQFAQRFAHLQSFAPGLKSGDLVLAGQFIGRVGSTGNVTPSSGCSSSGGQGAHAHIVLYKHVPAITGRPLVENVLSGGPSFFAAQYRYISPVTLAKASANPTIYALDGGFKVPISASSFEDNGWWFDLSRNLFDPMNNAIRSESELARYLQVGWLWPFRTGTLAKAENDQTVFLFQDGRRKGLTFDVFNCRGFRFDDVKVLPSGEIGSYLPNQIPVARGCKDEQAQALSDFVQAVSVDRRFGPIQLGTYAIDFEWNAHWELRSVIFHFTSQRLVTVHHSTSKHDPSERYTIYWDPDISNWSGWRRMY